MTIFLVGGLGDPPGSVDQFNVEDVGFTKKICSDSEYPIIIHHSPLSPIRHETRADKTRGPPKSGSKPYE
ncbi:hypothetical protein PGT21_027321 [Puccinia graminis f. sp. tritici]|uniref:Uncharacterized protein n=1 Tax=Puccinia graminis f. sp. tritici TaxID=56615 RepID=A0A5B0QGJ7_PUCGR|nr:hypothetical protein PGTUg99_013972 [Puccinia graminis f. sp. tritici]KAA1117916.1 hypothetical protein PGT21_027321 [Puccinia graminis f. sp. tritici]